MQFQDQVELLQEKLVLKRSKNYIIEFYQSQNNNWVELDVVSGTTLPQSSQYVTRYKYSSLLISGLKSK